MLKQTNFKLDPATIATIAAIAKGAGTSKTAIVETAIKLLDSATGPIPDDVEVLKSPPPPREMERPLLPQVGEYQPSPFTSWDPRAAINSKSQADSGDLELISDLWESMLADDEISGAMDLLCNGLQGLPLRFTGANEAAIEAADTDFWMMLTPGQKTLLRYRSYGVGICPLYTKGIVESSERQVPVFEVKDPRNLQWRWSPENGVEWYYRTSEGPIKLTDQPGRWFLFTPKGDPFQRPWVFGLAYSLANSWLLKSFAQTGLGEYLQSHGTAKFFLTEAEGTIAPGNDKVGARRQAIQFISRIPFRPGMFVPQGMKIEPWESTGAAAQYYNDVIDRANSDFHKRILGSDAGTTANATYASAYEGTGARWDITYGLAEAESHFYHDGPMTLWFRLNAKSGWTGKKQLTESGKVWMLEARERRATAQIKELSYIESRIRMGDEIPWPTYDTTPPEDLAKAADAQGKTATALVQLTQAATADTTGTIAAAMAQMDVVAYLGRVFPLKGKSETGIKLEDPLTLKTSRWDVFDPQYAADLKANYPDIWDAGGSTGAIHSGDSQYAILAPLWARGGVPRGEKEQDAVDTREAWAARHFGNNRLAGVVALIKWLVVGEIGEKAMKDVIEEEKKRLEKKIQLSDAPKNIRRHLHEGLQVVDETVEQLQQANPELMGDITGEILRTLAKAGGYTEARKELQSLFPKLDRKSLQDVMTGGMLLLQATGQYTVEQEGT